MGRLHSQLRGSIQVQLAAALLLAILFVAAWALSPRVVARAAKLDRARPRAQQ